MTRLTTCADAEAVAERAAARDRARACRARASERGVAHLALSGGTHAGAHLRAAGRASSPTGTGVEVWFADERCVAPEDEESNYRLAARDAARAQPAIADRSACTAWRASWAPSEGARALRAGAARARAAATATAPALPVLDLIVLGIGPDGHVASLFPGAPTLDAGEQALCLGVHDSPKPPPERITLSLAVLRAARRCVLLATGAGKADAVNAMLGRAEPPRAREPAATRAPERDRRRRGLARRRGAPAAD